MAPSKFNFAARNAGGKKKAAFQGAIARRMAAQNPAQGSSSAKDQSAHAAEQAAIAARNKGR
jgi:hypothetical protein